MYNVEFTKLVLQVNAVQQELLDIQQESLDMKQRIVDTKQHVQSLRHEVKQHHQVGGYKEEYEALAKMAQSRPSRIILEKRLLLATKQMQVATATERALEQEMELRQAQFHTLMQCMLDLKASMDVAVPQQQQDENTSTTRNEKEEDEEGEEGEEGVVVPMDTT